MHLFADQNAFPIAPSGRRADVTEVVVEHHGALIHAHRQHEIRVHHAFICVDHEIWIDPQIKGAALPRGAYTGFGVFSRRKRAGLQAGPFEILDRIFRVLDHAAEALVRVRHVVSAVEIVVYVYLPVAIQCVHTAIEVLQFLAQLQGSHQVRYCAQKIA